jgi:hypothetical protein
MSSELMVSEILKGISTGFMQGQQMGALKRESDRKDKESQLSNELKQIQIQRAREDEGPWMKPMAPGTPVPDQATALAIREVGGREQWGWKTKEEQDALIKEKLAWISENTPEKPNARMERLKMSERQEKEQKEVLIGSGELRSAKDRATFIKQQGEVDTAAMAISEIRGLEQELTVGGKLTKARFDEVAAQIQAKRAQIKAGIRIAVTGGGNISGPEQKLLDSIVADPTEIMRNPKAAMKALDSLDRGMQQKLIVEAMNRGVYFSESQLAEMHRQRPKAMKWFKKNKPGMVLSDKAFERRFPDKWATFQGSRPQKPGSAKDMMAGAGAAVAKEASSQPMRFELSQRIDNIMRDNPGAPREEIIKALKEKGLIPVDYIEGDMANGMGGNPLSSLPSFGGV